MLTANSFRSTLILFAAALLIRRAFRVYNRARTVVQSVWAIIGGSVGFIVLLLMKLWLWLRGFVFQGVEIRRILCVAVDGIFLRVLLRERRWRCGLMQELGGTFGRPFGRRFGCFRAFNSHNSWNSVAGWRLTRRRVSNRSSSWNSATYRRVWVSFVGFTLRQLVMMVIAESA